MVKVQISEKGGQQSDYEFDKPEVTIGRMKGNDIVLPKGNVSKKHARIYDRSGTLMIDDLDSTNGTYVNGRKVTSEHEITENDKIYIGDFILQVEPERQQAGGPPKAPPRPPGGGEGARDDSPPSAPQGGGGGGGPRAGGSGGGPAAGSGGGPSAGPGGGPAAGSGGGPSAGSGGGPATGSGGSPSAGPGSGSGPAGRTEQGSDGIGALDDKYGTGSDDSTPGRTSRDTGGSEPSGGGIPSPGSSPGRGGGDEDGGGRSRNSTDRDRPTAGGDNRSGGPPRRDGSSPGASGRSARDSTPGAPRSGSGSAPSSAPDSRPTGPDSRPTGPDRGEGRGSQPASGLERGPTAEAPEVGQADEGRQRRRGGEQFRKDLRADRAREGAVGQPALPPELESEFDESFHEAQQEVAEVLVDELDFDDLPLNYPALRSHRTKYRDVVEEAVEEVDPTGADEEALIEWMTSEVVGIGPLEDFLDDDEVRNIYVNRYDTVVLLRGDDLVVAERAFSHPQLLELAAERLVGSLDADTAAHRERLDDGTQLHVVDTPVAVDGPAITVRKSPAARSELDDLVQGDVLSGGMATFLKRAVEAGQSILVAGPTNSGKSEMLEALAREIPDGSRLVVVEESSQLELPQRGVVRLQARPDEGFDMEEVLDAAVSMHPERIVLDACRGAEAYTWVSSAASGTKGSMATVDGLNASDALGRLESLALIGSGEISPRGLREQIARAVDLVVTMHRSSDGTLRLRQITEVQGVDLDAYRLNEIFYYRREGTSGAFHPTGYIPLFYEDLRKLGRDVDLDIFRE